MTRLCAILFSLTASSALFACSLCSVTLPTLSESMNGSVLVAFGTFANPRFSDKPGAPVGSGTTDFNVEQIVKNDTEREVPGRIVVPRYMPVIDPKNPPRFLLFFRKDKDQLDAFHGVSLKSAELSPYLAGARSAWKKSRMDALMYYSRYLDHADETVSSDAFLEFAKAKDDEVGAVAKAMSAPRLRQLLAQESLPAERFGLFAFLLGRCGEKTDVALFEKWASETERSGLDGVLAGYIAIAPEQGWKKTAAMLVDQRVKFPARFNALRAIRFFHNWKGSEVKAEILSALGPALADGEIADLLIEDLRRWKMWELTPRIVELFPTPTFKSPIMQRTILRYALSCPNADAKAFVESQQPRYAKVIDDIRDLLEFEAK